MCLVAIQLRFVEFNLRRAKEPEIRRTAEGGSNELAHLWIRFAESGKQKKQLLVAG
jgi:hypothetical protein